MGGGHGWPAGEVGRADWGGAGGGAAWSVLGGWSVGLVWGGGLRGGLGPGLFEGASLTHSSIHPCHSPFASLTLLSLPPVKRKKESLLVVSLTKKQAEPWPQLRAESKSQPAVD